MFIVIEIQKNNDTVTPFITVLFDKDTAHSNYHGLCAVASVSDVKEHSVFLISDEGNYMFYEKYEHMNA